jgi:hypothetical protein
MQERGGHMSEAIMVALITGILSLIGSLCGVYYSQRKSTALIAYRLEQLENKVNKHNQLIERTYALERRCDVYDEKFRVVNHRVEDLEGGT